MVGFERFGEDNTDSNLVGRIILRPNQSLSWQASKYFLLLLLMLSLAIASGFLLQGYWMILPFSLLEVTIVAACFYAILRRSRMQQVIEFSPNEVHFAEGQAKPETRVLWPRYFTKILIEQAPQSWYAPEIRLTYKDAAIELGSFLNADEKDQLIDALKELVALADHRQVHRT